VIVAPKAVVPSLTVEGIPNLFHVAPAGAPLDGTPAPVTIAPLDTIFFPGLAATVTATVPAALPPKPSLIVYVNVSLPE
jgi:hypothetical protein